MKTVFGNKVIAVIFILIFVLVVAAIWYFGFYNRIGETPPGNDLLKNNDDAKTIAKNNMHKITLSTSMGDMVFETYDEDAPKTVQNFITLVEKKYYDGLTFHRVIKGFMIQGGDPNCTATRSSGLCGTGGPGYRFEDELNPLTPSYEEGYKKGVVAMANAGPNTNGSQFFIMLENTPLPHNYTIFGKVVLGQDLVDKIGSVKTGAGDRPVEAVVIESVKVDLVRGN